MSKKHDNSSAVLRNEMAVRGAGIGVASRFSLPYYIYRGATG